MARKRSRRGGGGKRHGKLHHPWRPKAGAEYGLALCDPWITHQVHSTRVSLPRSDIATMVAARLRAKHTEILGVFEPDAYIADLLYYLGPNAVSILDRGERVVNIPPARLADEEAWLF